MKNGELQIKEHNRKTTFLSQMQKICYDGIKGPIRKECQLIGRKAHPEATIYMKEKTSKDMDEFFPDINENSNRGQSNLRGRGSGRGNTFSSYVNSESEPTFS